MTRRSGLSFVAGLLLVMTTQVNAEIWTLSMTRGGYFQSNAYTAYTRSTVRKSSGAIDYTCLVTSEVTVIHYLPPANVFWEDLTQPYAESAYGTRYVAREEPAYVNNCYGGDHFGAVNTPGGYLSLEGDTGPWCRGADPTNPPT